MFRFYLPSPSSPKKANALTAHCRPRCALRGAMSAPPSPSNSEASTANFTLEALADEVLDAFGDHPPPTARASVEAWLQHLEAGGVMPSPQELIGLLSAFLQERALPPRPLTDDALAALGDVNAIGAVLIQDEPDYFHFPHFVDGEDWKQCKSKLTHIGVRLVSPAGDPVHGTAVQRGGLELMLELVNANTNETLQDPQLTGVAGGAFEQCAAARACRPRPPLPPPRTVRLPAHGPNAVSTAGRWFCGRATTCFGSRS